MLRKTLLMRDAMPLLNLMYGQDCSDRLSNAGLTMYTQIVCVFDTASIPALGLHQSWVQR